MAGLAALAGRARRATGAGKDSPPRCPARRACMRLSRVARTVAAKRALSTGLPSSALQLAALLTFLHSTSTCWVLLLEIPASQRMGALLVSAQGGYWHLDTRPDEHAAMPRRGWEGRLRKAARAIDRRLRADPMQARSLAPPSRMLRSRHPVIQRCLPAACVGCRAYCTACQYPAKSFRRQSNQCWALKGNAAQPQYVSLKRGNARARQSSTAT